MGTPALPLDAVATPTSISISMLAAASASVPVSTSLPLPMRPNSEPYMYSTPGSFHVVHGVCATDNVDVPCGVPTTEPATKRADGQGQRHKVQVSYG